MILYLIHISLKYTHTHTHAHTHIYGNWVQITRGVTLNNITSPNNLL